MWEMNTPLPRDFLSKKRPMELHKKITYMSESQSHTMSYPTIFTDEDLSLPSCALLLLNSEDSSSSSSILWTLAAEEDHEGDIARDLQEEDVADIENSSANLQGEAGGGMTSTTSK